ncbi:hypothetical protein BU24DRAFT_446085 [Aaosphaeria arxii CBS 175.79]|uniref:IEC3 subunit of the Ino80 complex, chromatin re-modelling-domain-containing protein n=1 Tax=Aaosphaeria arxii CBS 175.79 TaxID=1450172 RepID=A0A6A5Y7I9_9PLEO|nr:uncharacterized protein BU24DRAFT_446085 [Aaosphaeria arxii CBS 175.79]KAF2020967.1 hypothetical protein BU24DRAFT_446085 [Aaosphaeria arxii CBS 175.79]
MASEASVPADTQLPEAPLADHDASRSAPKPPASKHSWRRKYRKMRAKFEDTMNTSNTLIKDEHRARATARRLQEQNDQILDLLLDMNENARLPANLRFDLRELSDVDSIIPTLEPDPEAIHQKLQEYRSQLVDGTITSEEFARRSDQLHSSQSIITNRTLPGFEAKVPHTTEIPDPVPDGLMVDEQAPGYMSPAHEEEYLLALDLALAEPSFEQNVNDGRPIRITTVRSVPSEKDLSIQNPDSVYNWLRKHQPQVFLQDKDPQPPESISEKSSARPANVSSRGKRLSTGPKVDPDAMDEDVPYVPEIVTPVTKTRKAPKEKEDDGAYRPKGGSSRATKRKREEGDPATKGSRKKGRASGGTAASS